MPSPTQSYSLLLKRFEDDQPFSFSRWGDGEWEAVLDLKNEHETNCDGHQYFASLKEALHKILVSNPSYLVGMQKLAYHKVLGREIDAYLKTNRIKREWLNADAFHSASSKGEIKSFFDILAKKNVLLIGPAYLKKLNTFTFDFCEVPVKNCWLERDRILQEINEITRTKTYDVILFCAGMTSNWFVDQLHNNFPGFILDIGSVLDPYAGVNTRNYHRKLSDTLRASLKTPFDLLL